jgi:predicted TIM-barrel fold metal-dependent hydrolase
MALSFKLVSADSHVVEPRDLWTTRIDRRFLDRAPRYVNTPNGECLMIDGQIMETCILGLLATKKKFADPDTRFGLAGYWNDVPEASYDPNIRIKELDREGIEAELLYTSQGLNFYAIQDHELRYACFRAFNDWLADFCTAVPKRLFGIGMISTDDPDRDVAELERCAKMGLKGAIVSIRLESGEGHSSKRWDKFWSAAEALEIPISLHVGASETSFVTTGSMFVDFTCVFTPTMYTVTSMIFSGLFDRHPKLKVLSVENDASWPLAVLERMDDRWIHDGRWASTTGELAAFESGRKPSQVFHDHVACTFIRDRTAILNREIIGCRNLMWGSDFPHFDGAWPACATVLERQFAGIPLGDQIRIGRTNVIEFYKLPLDGRVPAATG